LAEHSHDAHVALNMLMPELLSQAKAAADQQYARENQCQPKDNPPFNMVDESVEVEPRYLPKENHRKKSCTSPKKRGSGGGGSNR
jgi:hypothetical protein